jgi:hypothetical protein
MRTFDDILFTLHWFNWINNNFNFNFNPFFFRTNFKLLAILEVEIKISSLCCHEENQTFTLLNYLRRNDDESQNLCLLSKCFQHRIPISTTLDKLSHFPDKKRRIYMWNWNRFSSLLYGRLSSTFILILLSDKQIGNNCFLSGEWLTLLYTLYTCWKDKRKESEEEMNEYNFDCHFTEYNSTLFALHSLLVLTLIFSYSHALPKTATTSQRQSQKFHR